jgi:hypothetical protein
VRFLLIAVLLLRGPLHEFEDRVLLSHPPVPVYESPTLANPENFLLVGEIYSTQLMPDQPLQPVFQKMQGRLIAGIAPIPGKLFPYSNEPVRIINVHLLVPRVHSP